MWIVPPGIKVMVLHIRYPCVSSVRLSLEIVGHTCIILFEILITYHTDKFKDLKQKYCSLYVTKSSAPRSYHFESRKGITGNSSTEIWLDPSGVRETKPCSCRECNPFMQLKFSQPWKNETQV
jgi:hypothetical protein